MRERALRDEAYQLKQARLEGEARGEAIGQAKGMLAAKRETLQNLIQLEFGDLPEWAQEKINTAEKEDLDQWVVATLTANSIEELLATDEA